MNDMNNFEFDLFLEKYIGSKLNNFIFDLKNCNFVIKYTTPHIKSHHNFKQGSFVKNTIGMFIFQNDTYTVSLL